MIVGPESPCMKKVYRKLIPQLVYKKTAKNYLMKRLLNGHGQYLWNVYDQEYIVNIMTIASSG